MVDRVLCGPDHVLFRLYCEAGTGWPFAAILLKILNNPLGFKMATILEPRITLSEDHLNVGELYSTMQSSCFDLVQFNLRQTARLVRPTSLETLGDDLALLELQGSRPVIVLVGGASHLQKHHMNRLRSLFVKVLAPLAELLSAIVIDGGTDTGVMRMMGNARSKIHASFPLLGILPIGLASLPTQPNPHPEAAPLEPHHTHFLLVPGQQWGDESHWIAETASLLADGCPTVTVLINGGEITWKDASESVDAGRPIIAIEGSGRAADALGAALQGNITDARAKKIIASGLLQAVSIENDDSLLSLVEEILSNPSAACLESPRSDTPSPTAYASDY
jgi:hypothetical protein